MSDLPLPPRSPSRRRADTSDRRANRTVNTLPVATGPAEAAPVKRTGVVASFVAQLLGQDGQKRGLRGGPETLNTARSSYLGAEWSGPADRRPKAGRITKTEI